MHQLIDKKNIIVIYLILLLVLSTTSNKFKNKQNSYYSQNNKINVTGLSAKQNSKIVNEINRIHYQNILSIDKEKINKIISRYNIVEKYTIKRIYPSSLNIVFRPTNFVAKISNESQLLVGENGKLVENQNNQIELPFIFGKYNSIEFLRLKKNIDLSRFEFTEFKTLFFFPSNRWDILTINDNLIKLPKDGLLQSLNFSYKILTNDEFKDKNLIDLRIKNKLVIK